MYNFNKIECLAALSILQVVTHPSTNSAQCHAYTCSDRTRTDVFSKWYGRRNDKILLIIINAAIIAEKIPIYLALFSKKVAKAGPQGYKF